MNTQGFKNYLKSNYYLDVFLLVNKTFTPFKKNVASVAAT